MTDYSRGDYADLPAGKTDLENNYTAPDLTAIASNDNSTYAEQTANNEIAIHQYKKTVAGQYTNITWSGKSSLAPSESPVIMEVYNVTGTPAWEELDRDDSTAADTDFDIIYNNLATADYLDSGVITWRVYQAASAGFTALASDAFTDANATAIGDHTTDGGAQATYGDITVAAGGSGLTWTAVGGVVTIESNRAQGAIANEIFALLTPGQNTFSIRAMMYGATGSGNHAVGLVIRWTNSTNYVLCMVGDDNNVVVRHRLADEDTTYGPYSVSTFTGKLMELVVSSSSFDVYYDGTKLNGESPLAIDGALTANTCGIFFHNDENLGSIDNFLVYA